MECRLAEQSQHDTFSFHSVFSLLLSLFKKSKFEVVNKVHGTRQKQWLVRFISYSFLFCLLQDIHQLCQDCSASGKVRIGQFLSKLFRLIRMNCCVQHERFFRTQRQILDTVLGVIVWKELTEVDFFSGYIWDGLAMMITNLEEVVFSFISADY